MSNLVGSFSADPPDLQFSALPSLSPDEPPQKSQKRRMGKRGFKNRILGLTGKMVDKATD